MISCEGEVLHEEGLEKRSETDQIRFALFRLSIHFFTCFENVFYVPLTNPALTFNP